MQLVVMFVFKCFGTRTILIPFVSLAYLGMSAFFVYSSLHVNTVK